MIPSPIVRTSRAGLAGALVFFSCAIGAAGCAAELETDYVDTPVNVQAYPHEVYGGRDVYYVGGRWQYQSGGRWAAYRRPPEELERRRAAHPVEHVERERERR